MSYTTYRDKPVSEKIILVEIDTLMTADTFVDLQPGVWYMGHGIRAYNKSFGYGSGCFGFGAFGTGGVADMSDGRPEKARIRSLYAGDEWYTEASSLSSVISTDTSFWFDTGARRLYVHFPNFAPPLCFRDDLKLGVAQGFGSKGAYYDDVYYDPRVLSVPQLSRSKDPLFFGKISFDGGTVALNNADGAFDTFQADYDVYGAVVRILLGFEDNAYADFKTMYEGYLENLRVTEDRVELRLNDKRKLLSRTVPVNVFNKTDYPNLHDDDVDKPIPLAYGDLRGIPVTCVNRGASAASYTFKICDTTYRAITAIDAVYVEGGTARTSVKWSGTSLTDATFALTVGVYKYASDEVFADIQGYASGGTLLENGLEVIRDVLANHYNRPYTSTFYNTTGWGSAESVAASIAILIEEPTEGWKVIEDICASLAGNFIVQDDGLYNFRAYDSARAVDQTIEHEELLGPLEVLYDTEEVLSSVRVGYDRHWGDGEFREYLYNSTESIIADRFKAYNERTFETLLKSSTSAATFAATIMEISGGARPILRARTKLQSIDRELSDMVNVEYRTRNRAFTGTMSCEVIGKTVDLDAMIVELTLRKP